MLLKYQDRDSFDHPTHPRDFAPTDDPRCVVVVDRTAVERGVSIVQALQLGDGLHVRWQHKRTSLEEVLKRRLENVWLIPGPERPCRHLPLLLVPAVQSSGPYRPLWMLDSQTGRLAGPKQLPGRFDPVVFEYSGAGLTLRANRDGRLLAFCPEDQSSSDPIACRCV